MEEWEQGEGQIDSGDRPLSEFIRFVMAVDRLERESYADLGNVTITKSGATAPRAGRPKTFEESIRVLLDTTKMLQKALLEVAEQSATTAQSAMDRWIGRISTAVSDKERRIREILRRGMPSEEVLAEAKQVREDRRELDELQQYIRLYPQQALQEYAQRHAREEIQRYLTQQYTRYLRERGVSLVVDNAESADVYLTAAGFPDYIENLMALVDAKVAPTTGTERIEAARQIAMEGRAGIKAAQWGASTYAALSRVREAQDRLRADTDRLLKNAEDFTAASRTAQAMLDPKDPRFPAARRALDAWRKSGDPRYVIAQELLDRWTGPEFSPEGLSEKRKLRATRERDRAEDRTADVAARALRAGVPEQYRISLISPATTKPLGFVDDSRECFDAEGLPLMFALPNGDRTILVEPTNPSISAGGVVTVWVKPALFKLLYTTEVEEMVQMGFDPPLPGYRAMPTRDQLVTLVQREATNLASRAKDRVGREDVLEGYLPTALAIARDMASDDIDDIVDAEAAQYQQALDDGLPDPGDYATAEEYFEDLYRYAVNLWGINERTERSYAGSPDVVAEKLRRLKAGRADRKDRGIAAAERVDVLDSWTEDGERLEKDVALLRAIRAASYSDFPDYSRLDIPPWFESVATTESRGFSSRAVEKLSRAMGASGKERRLIWLVLQPAFVDALSVGELQTLAGRLKITGYREDFEEAATQPQSNTGKLQLALAQAIQCARAFKEEDGFRLVLIPSLALFLSNRLASLYIGRAESTPDGIRYTAPAIEAALEDVYFDTGRPSPGQEAARTKAERLRTALVDQAVDLYQTLKAAINELTFPAGVAFEDPRNPGTMLVGKGCPLLTTPDGAWAQVSRRIREAEPRRIAP